MSKPRKQHERRGWTRGLTPCTETIILAGEKALPASRTGTRHDHEDNRQGNIDDRSWDLVQQTKCRVHMVELVPQDEGSTYASLGQEEKKTLILKLSH